MPGIIVHTLLGNALLDHWQAAPGDAPFPASDESCRLMFLTGCSGPDMGMYPGGKPLFSDLAHYVNSGKLAATLVAEARTNAERAFAWGWFSHVLADVQIHPLVNLGAGDAGGTAPLSFVENPGLHIAIETAIDGYYFPAFQKRGTARLQSVPGDFAQPLSRAYRAVFGEVVNETDVHATLDSWNRWHTASISMAANAANRLFDAPRSTSLLYGVTHRAARALTAAFARRSAIHALTHPIRPSERVFQKIAEAITAYPNQFQQHATAGLDDFPDYNLDTGKVENPIRYPLAVKTLSRLERPAPK